MLALLGLGVATPALATVPGTILYPGQKLLSGQSMVSPNGGFTLSMQTDGTLILYLNPAVYNNKAVQVLWYAPNTYGFRGRGPRALAAQSVPPCRGRTGRRSRTRAR
jgi:hypothetical protein